ncbi:MAG: 30S ribosomal protein S3ae [Candidatus Aenigmatarchaeota archaeon]
MAVQKTKQFKKEWIKVISPEVFGNVEIGETPVMELENCIGRVIETSLYELTGDASKYYINLLFKINKIEGAHAKTVFHGHYCTSDFISRIVQPRTSRVDIILPVKFKDASLILKMIAITNRRVGKRIASEIRKKVSEIVKNYAEQTDLNTFLKSFISGQIQTQIRQEANKIYPLRIFEIHKSEVQSLEKL